MVVSEQGGRAVRSADATQVARVAQPAWPARVADGGPAARKAQPARVADGMPENIAGTLQAVDGTAIRVRQERCAKVRNRNVTCLKCADACTSGCITFDGERLAVDASKCVGCGTCATVCPTCALESRNPTDAQLLSACRTVARAGTSGLGDAAGGAVTIVCEPLKRALGDLLDASKVATVVCAGRIDESLIAGLAAAGVRSVRIACGRCTRCEQAHGLATATAVADTARTLFAAWDVPVDVQVAEGVGLEALARGVALADAQRAIDGFFAQVRGNRPVREGEPSRRAARQSEDARKAMADGCAAGAVCADEDGASAAASDAGAVVAADAGAFQFQKVMKDGTLPHFLPDRRERLLDALSQLGQPKPARLNTRLWGSVVINGAACTSCRMCATFCPTGAIRKFDLENGEFGVDHFPADCVKCGSCRDVCAADAITLLDEVDPMQLACGGRHRYRMTPRDVELNDAHQIVNTMKRYLGSELYER